MSVAYFIHQRPSAISDEPGFDQPSSADVGAQPATIAHPWYHSELRLLSLSCADQCLFLHENFTGTWWDELAGGWWWWRRAGAVFHRFCQMCLYANDSMSDNLPSQPLMSEPPDSLSLFIPGHF